MSESCCKCSAAMSPGIAFFTDLDDRSFCDTCWNKEKCTRCNNPIPPTVRVVKVFKGQKYHTDCWRCSICKGSLKDDPHDDGSGWNMCVSCAEVCASCSGNLGIGKRMELGGKVYHKECFKCSKCSISLGEEVYMLEDNVVCKICAEANG